MLAFSEVSLSFKNARDEKTLPGLDKVWKYLLERGITRLIADQCGLHIMPAVELIAAARRSPNINAVDGRAAVIFPHYRLGQPTEPIDWWSSRLVSVSSETSGLRVVASFGDLVDRARAPTWGKMFCPPNEAPHGYFPPIYDWSKLDVGQRVYIHESAIKAINGCLLGKASVGLNGVWGWGSKKHAVALIEELKDLPWKARQLEPVIVFDSNAWDNWQVQAAEARLASKLYEITGRLAISLRVPKPKEGDEGFDDFRARVGDKAALKFLESAGQPIDIDEIEMMKVDLNSQVCVVRSMGVVAEQATGNLMSRGTFCDLVYAHYAVRVESDTGRTSMVNVPKLWLADSRKSEVEKLEYAPGEPRLLEPEGPEGFKRLNTWNAMGLQPLAGEVETWVDLLLNSVHDDDLRHWILCWCAYPLQNPGKKLMSYPLIFGPSGTGKGMFFMPLHRVYGENAILIGKDNITSSFNSVYANKQFIHLDELQKARHGDNDDVVTQKVKMLTTAETMVVNTKGVREYTTRNVANLAVTSNYWDCVKLDADDRRACVIRWDPTGVKDSVDHRGDQEYWTRYVRWVDDGGAASVYAYLLSMDLSEFNPHAWAPDTPWKEQVKDATRSSLAAWVKDLFDEPLTVLPLGGNGKCLYTSKELCTLYLGLGESEISPSHVKGMANELRNAGFAMAADGALLRAPGGPASRYWVISRQGETWDQKACARHLRMLSR